jgi:hypothetical protein
MEEMATSPLYNNIRSVEYYEDQNSCLEHHDYEAEDSGIITHHGRQKIMEHNEVFERLWKIMVLTHVEKYYKVDTLSRDMFTEGDVRTVVCKVDDTQVDYNFIQYHYVEGHKNVEVVRLKWEDETHRDLVLFKTEEFPVAQLLGWFRAVQ